MEYLYRIHPARLEMLRGGATSGEAEVVSEHFKYLKSLTDQGVVILAGRTLTEDESSFGIVIFEAGDEESAQSIMRNDPAVRKNVMRAELFPFRIALMAGIQEDRS